nr:L-threonylcarbamoyladenylate synthase [Polycladospora coralii]
MSIEQLRRKIEITEAASRLRAGDLVAFPTETVYGLGAVVTSEEAIARIFEAKGRPSDNPLIIHIGKKEQIYEWAQLVSKQAERLIDAFWPGPLTLVLPHRDHIAKNVTAGLPTVAIRMPAHPIALALLQETGIPVAAPSANRSGKPSPTSASHVWDDLQGRIDILLDGGRSGIGVESTVIDMTGEVPVLLRPGGITLAQLEGVVGKVETDPGLINDSQTPRSPGMKYRHYAPSGEMTIVSGNGEFLQDLVDQARAEGKKTGILTTSENVDKYRADVIIPCGDRKEPVTVAKHLYASLRQFDDRGVEVIFAESFPETGVFHSVMNRLRKAANGKIV